MEQQVTNSAPPTLKERIGVARWEAEQDKVDREKPTRVVTVRMPRATHERLRSLVERREFDVSINRVCVAAIEAALDELELELVAMSGEQAKGETCTS